MSKHNHPTAQIPYVDHSTIHTNIKEFVEGKHLENLLQTKIDMLMEGAKTGFMGCWEYLIAEKKLAWSDGMYKLYEVKPGQEITPRFYFDFAVLTDKNLVEAIIRNMITDFNPFEEIITRLQNGKQKSIWIKADVIRNSNQEPVKVIGMDMDISKTVNNFDQVQALKRQLILKNRELEAKNSELKTFNNVAANEYSDTLKNLYTCMEFIITTDARNLSNASKANIRRAQTAIQKMKLMTNDIVNFARLHTLESDISLVDLSAVIKLELRYLEEKINESDATIIFDELPIVQGFPLLLSVLFHHLIDNSLKFRSKERKPEINISSAVVEGRYINHSNAMMDIRYHVLKFSDNGIGFEHHHSEIIFQMFYRLQQEIKYKGSGLGLAICKKIMDLHDGFIIADGRPDVGATFNCYFPIES